MESLLIQLLTRWREPTKDKPAITEIFLGALGIHGEKGFQCEIGFGDTSTISFQDDHLDRAVGKAFAWAVTNLGS